MTGTEAKFLIGEIHRRADERSSAEQHYLEAIANDPEHADALRELGLLYRSGRDMYDVELSGTAMRPRTQQVSSQRI